MDNVLMGVYFAHLGYNYEDAIKMFGHDPNDIQGSYVDAQGHFSQRRARWNGIKFVPE
jgi:hypothetical protein